MQQIKLVEKLIFSWPDSLKFLSTGKVGIGAFIVNTSILLVWKLPKIK